MIHTIVMNANGRKVWEGRLPLLAKGQRINLDGSSYQVVESALGLYTQSSNQEDPATLQSVVMERTRD
jgi:hypothetical protein